MSNHWRGSIFYNVVKSENTVTDVLCNLFQYKHIRDTLLRFFEIPDEMLKLINYENCETQRVDEDAGKPDIQIGNPKVAIFFENKVNRNAPLQQSQIRHYLEKLEQYRKKQKFIWMIYLVPKNYTHIGEIEKAIKGKNYAKIYHWEEFIKYIQQTDLHRTNQLVSEFINHYSALYVDESLSLTLTTKEMELISKPKEFIIANQLLSKLTKIMEDVKNLIKKELGENISFERSDKKEEDYWHNLSEKGFYIRYKNEPLLFFGLWFDLYKDSTDKDNEMPKSSDYLFCYAIGTDENWEPKPEYFERFKTLTAPDFIKRGDWYAAKFPNFTFSDENVQQKIADVLIERIKSLIQ